MMAPDYTHWHGIYEVAKHWYTKFIPELQEIADARALHSDDPAKVEGAQAARRPRSTSCWRAPSTPGTPAT